MARARLVGMLLLLGDAVVFAQTSTPPPDLTGTWALDAASSRVEAEAGLAGLIGVGAPETLHISQAMNGTVVVESQINQSHARVYTPGGKSETPVFLGEAGRVTMTSRWEGRTLVSEGSRESTSSTPSVVTQVTETLALDPDAGALEIRVTSRGSKGNKTSTLRYRRTDDVGLCESWPSPCKHPSQ